MSACTTIFSFREFWEKNNKELPTKIIVYRDGIGEGDLNSVKEIEIEGIKVCIWIDIFHHTCNGYLMVKSAIAEAKRAVKAPNHVVGLEYVIVSKRINTRFFQNRNGSWANPMCGTVVDNVVTLPERMDFFLVSQNANQGTVSPTSYNIICNTGGLSIDHHQRLAYYLTHLYYNWAVISFKVTIYFNIRWILLRGL